jgi:hypothetical protein
MWLVGQVMHTLPEHLDSPPVFGGVPVAQSCIFCVACILRRLLFPLSPTRPLPDLPICGNTTVSYPDLPICGNTTVSYKKRELPTLRENLGLPTLFYVSHMAHLFSFCVVVFFCCLRYVSLAQYCLWIQIFWLHLWLVKVYFLLFGIHFSLLFTISFKFPGNSIIIAVK